jgi:hypothetical protein
MRVLANIVGYQCVWFAAVLGAVHGRWWSGVVAACAFVFAQGIASRDRAIDARLLVWALLAGIVLDGSLAASGVLRYASPQPALVAPLWILALWAAFAMTINHSLAFLRNSPIAALVFGAIGAPLAYSAAARGFGAVEFIAPAWRGAVALAAGWAVALVLLTLLARRSMIAAQAAI